MAKKVPMRMCVGCREMKPKKELLRIVRSPDTRSTGLFCKVISCMWEKIVL